jgi:hypothetical protein
VADYASSGAKSAPAAEATSMAPPGAYPQQPSAAPAPVAPAPPSATAPATSGASGESSASRRAPREESADVAPSQRPGLGTEWGETRYSHVTDVPFLRADEDTPFAIASLRYDDRKGVEALASFHARTSPLSPWIHDVPAANGAVTVSVRDGRGSPLDARRVGDRTYVVGRAGDRYAIVLSNHTRHRFEAVATVDGLDVINGRAGSLENRGYLLEPFSSLEIDGFRQSSEAVAAFRFGKVADSYAAQTGSARDVGVIGVAFFAERGDRFDDDSEARLRDSANPFPADDRFARPPRR